MSITRVCRLSGEPVELVLDLCVDEWNFLCFASSAGVVRPIESFEAVVAAVAVVLALVGPADPAVALADLVVDPVGLGFGLGCPDFPVAAWQ